MASGAVDPSPRGDDHGLAALVADLRSVDSRGERGEEWARAASVALSKFLDRPGSAGLVAGLEAAPHNWLLHAEPDDGFTVAALVKEEGQVVYVHDHGPTWTVYGVISGTETIRRYERLDDGSEEGRAVLREGRTFVAKPGDVDVVEPWAPHAEVGGPGGTTAVIIRSRPLGTFPQNYYNVELATVELFPGGLARAVAP